MLSCLLDIDRMESDSDVELVGAKTTVPGMKDNSANGENIRRASNSEQGKYQSMRQDGS